MNRIKNGFTLIEILGVIIILSLLMIIAVPSFLDLISGSRRQNKELIYDYIIDATKTYLHDVEEGHTSINNLYGYDFIKDSNIDYVIDLEYLITNGYYNENCNYEKALEDGTCKVTGNRDCKIIITKNTSDSNGYKVIDDYEISLGYKLEDGTINELKKDNEDIEKCIK